MQERIKTWCQNVFGKLSGWGASIVIFSFWHMKVFGFVNRCSCKRFINHDIAQNMKYVLKSIELSFVYLTNKKLVLIYSWCDNKANIIYLYDIDPPFKQQVSAWYHIVLPLTTAVRREYRPLVIIIASPYPSILPQSGSSITPHSTQHWLSFLISNDITT